MDIIINNLKHPINHTAKEVILSAKEYIKKFNIIAEEPEIYRRSVDARRNKISIVYSVKMKLILGEKNIEKAPDIRILDNKSIVISSPERQEKIYIIGSGPCGLFAAYNLALAGFQPVIIERGGCVEERDASVKKLFKEGILDLSSNVQFGEGGAGTFSDGKLNTRIGSPLERNVLETFVLCGASEDILINAKPHIGTDVLKTVLVNMREKIESLGGKYLFNTKLTDIMIKNGKVSGIVLNNNEIIECNKLVLAIGHSSRDTYEMLYDKGVVMQQKAFAAGVRIEHKQEFINKLQYGNEYKNPALPVADYRVVYNGEKRSCYSFCMCPGGYVVNASSEDGCFTVNGMSNFKRDNNNANSALVVNIRPEDFGDNSPLAGINFQRKYERLAFKLSGGYNAPVQLSEDFLKDKVSSSFRGVTPSFTGKTIFADLRECLPEFICNTLKDGLSNFENRMKGFVSSGSVLTGIEMRTSAPVRILRGENYQSVNVQGLYPAGEGAGYAGGIMSAAIDGIKIAQKISVK